MDTAKSAPWIVGAAFCAVAILVLSWMFAISPMMTSAADARSQTVQERASNQALTVQLTKLADQFANLDKYKTDLAALRLQIPEQVDPAGLNTELSGLATSTGVTLKVVTVGIATPFVRAVAVAAPAATPAQAAAPATGAATAPAAAPAATSAAFFAVPVTLDLVGTYDQVTAFLSSFQTGSQRLFLATGINAVAQTATGATAGQPAVAAGDLDLTVTGFAYVQPKAQAVAAAPAAGTAPKLPEPSGQKNPFVPVA